MNRGQVYQPMEYLDMLFVYCECGYNAREAARVYAERFPNRRAPNANVILSLVRRAGENGNLLPQNEIRMLENIRRPRRALTVRFEERILAYVENHPSTSIRKVSRHLNVSYYQVQRILKENKLHAFHYKCVQEFHEGDEEIREEFCVEMLRRINENPNFINKIMFSDESIFRRGDYHNCKNDHVYAYENPHAKKIKRHQRKYKINIWAAVLGNHLIGPWEFPTRINSRDYLEFLQTDLQELLDDIPLIDRERMWFMHDGAPIHTARIVKRHLKRSYRKRWIGGNRRAPIRWPPRSPDLNPIDFFLWGFIKDRVYAIENIEDRNHLRARITAAFDEITPQMLEAARNNFIKRLECCIEVEGGHIEHLMH